MRQHRFRGRGQLRNHVLRELLAEFNAPLVGRIDLPDRALNKHAVFVQRDKSAQGGGRQAFEQQRIGWSVACEQTVRNQPVRRAFGADFRFRLAESERLAFRKHISEQHVVVFAQRVQRLHEADEVAGDQPCPLMDELIE